jgi:hypothetical protein
MYMDWQTKCVLDNLKAVLPLTIAASNVNGHFGRGSGIFQPHLCVTIQ